MSDENWKPKVLIVGGLVGALCGLLAGFLYIRVAEEGDGPPQISTGNVIKLAIAAIGVVRQAAQLGA